MSVQFVLRHNENPGIRIQYFWSKFLKLNYIKVYVLHSRWIVTLYWKHINIIRDQYLGYVWNSGRTKDFAKLKPLPRPTWNLHSIFSDIYKKIAECLIRINESFKKVIFNGFLKKNARCFYFAKTAIFVFVKPGKCHFFKINLISMNRIKPFYLCSHEQGWVIVSLVEVHQTLLNFKLQNIATFNFFSKLLINALK